MPVISNRDIIIVGLQPWYTPIGSNCKNIALELSRHNRVLYINSPLDRRTVLRNGNDPDIARHIRIRKGQEPALLKISDNFWNFYPSVMLESINWLPSAGIFNFFNRINGRRYAGCIQKAVAELGFRDVILFNDNDIFRGMYLREILKPAMYIYYSRDNVAAMDWWKKHAPRVEPELIAKADVAVANSLFLAERLKQYNPNSHYIGQGCELSLFDPAAAYTRPAELEGLTGPVVGYVGVLTAMRLDPGILLRIAQERPDWNVVLVGPEDEVFQASALHKLPNVIFTGRKPMSELPSYMHYFDVCINPQVLNPVTEGNYPLKVDEYLAMGKPVVATATATMQLFKDHTYLAPAPADYVPLIERAMQENNSQAANARISFARSHTWESSVGALYDAIRHTMKNN